MTLLALIGSSGFLELAIVEENASMMLGVRTGTPLTVEWT
jgi:S-adenosylmethionine hydrolase